MPHAPMHYAEAEEKLRAYPTAYPNAYQRTVEQHYADTLREVEGMGRASELFPLHGRALGTSLALTALTTPYDFFLFFLDVPDTTATQWQHAWPSEGFSQAWTMQSPNNKALEHVREHLRLAREQEIHVVRIPGTDFMSTEIGHMADQADHHGSGAGNRDGAKAEALLPLLRESWQEDQSYASLRQRYQDLQNWSGTAPGTRPAVRDPVARRPGPVRMAPQEDPRPGRGQRLHRPLQRPAHPWRSPLVRRPDDRRKDARIPRKTRPTPQTIGLFISHSGYDDGARSVVRRAVNSKTVVLFSQPEIDDVLLNRTNPGILFNERLRDVYDYPFENQQN
ncbi:MULTISPECIES: hypothetical protein [Streptacidiphilus]|uniref:TIR domain-containing protein n=1 Tax=Streptacidiphilus cavernicola TaxID=3342716 RepID=A0ABV6V1G7_9ACTN|nr:hypothetical protein [Streptacidiphilus jeojiense]